METVMKIVKLGLLVLAGLLLILLLYALVLLLQWPRWVIFFLLLGLAGIVVGIIFLKKLLARRKEQQFVQQVIEQDEAALKKLAGKEHDEYRELQERWKEAVETLRRSHLKKQGNPLYVLPWYLVMGESGSGKTTALKSARLSSPFVEVQRASGISGTRSCDWWFFEQAIILDTAGRYAIPVDEGKDKEEWQRFLNLLVKYRKREPIHGLIVTVAADKLLSAPAEELESDARKIRSRIDELMRVLGVKFPIYLLVTKCDLVQGMAAFAGQLPEKCLEQPMGTINQEMSKEVAAFLEHALESIGERLRNYRLLLLHQPREGSAQPGALLFPEEFEELRRGLDPFLKGGFRENPYQDTPILRGLFFSSGRQEGTPFSHFLGALGLIAEKEVLPATGKGLFLHDFFAAVLPRDRGLFAPTRRALEWQSVTRNLGLASWLLVWLALCGLLGYSFVKNMAIIRDATAQFTRPPELTGNLSGDLLTMDRYRAMVAGVESRNRGWWIPRFGLNQSRKVEMALKERYCRAFKERFMVSYDGQLRDTLERFTPATPDLMVGHYVEHLVRRLNLLAARREGEGLEQLQARPLPSFVTAGNDQGGNDVEKKKFGLLYLSYLVWRGDPGETASETATLQRELAYLLDLKGGNLMWLVTWANALELPPVTLHSFWGGSGAVAGEKPIPPAYTRKGKEQMDAFAAEIGKAHPDPEKWQRALSSFDRAYREGCYASWQEFAQFFPKGAERLSGEREWRQVAERMTGESGPYQAFFKSASDQLQPLAGGEALHPWLKAVLQFQALKSAGVAATGAAQQGSKVLQGIEKALGKKQEGTTAADSVSAAAKALSDYRKALEAIAPAARDRRQAFQMALQVYGGDSAAGASPFSAASDAAERLSGLLSGAAGDQTWSRLVAGPVQFLWAFTRQEAACALQGAWEEKVLQEAQGGMDQQMMQYLVGPEGPVWKFVKGPAAPFLGWSPQRGYYSKEALGGALPFDPNFFAFLTRAAKAKVVVAPVTQSHAVTIRGLPTDANPEAKTLPELTRLELQCPESQVLENLNFAVSKTFRWSPEGCGDVLLTIQIGNLNLVKKYPGPQGFPLFLRDFPGGRHTFSPRDFPDQKGALAAMGIKYLRVNYQFSGNLPGMGPAQALPQWAPKKIVRCWD